MPGRLVARRRLQARIAAGGDRVIGLVDRADMRPDDAVGAEIERLLGEATGSSRRRWAGCARSASPPARPSRDRAIWPRLSMYCSESRSARMSQGLCSISKTMPSYLAVAHRERGLDVGVGEGGEARLPLLERADDAVQIAEFRPWLSSAVAWRMLAESARAIVPHDAASGVRFDSAGARSIASPQNREVAHDHRLPRPLHHRAASSYEAFRARSRSPRSTTKSTIPPRARRSATTRSARPSRTAQLKLQQERGTDLTIFSPRAAGMGASHRRRRDEPATGRAPATTSSIASARSSRRISSASASCRRSPGVSPANCIARARALRQGAGLHRLQPQSRSVGRLLDRPAADRPLVVSALREDGRARRAGDGACQRVVQSELPRHRRALHQRRHHGLHAVHHCRTCSRISRPCASSSRMAAARCPITGAAIAAWRRT